jgi:hypothetical protein
MSGGVGGEELTLQGIVIPTQWGPDGEVNRVGILTRGEGEYEVAPGGAGCRLMNHLRREVIALVTTVQGSEPEKSVRVNSFAVLEWDEISGDIMTPLEVDRA